MKLILNGDPNLTFQFDQQKVDVGALKSDIGAGLSGNRHLIELLATIDGEEATVLINPSNVVTAVVVEGVTRGGGSFQ